MSEKSLWRNLRTKMVPHFWFEATRHEDKLQAGIADVSFVHKCEGVRLHEGTMPSLVKGAHGWMELKKLSMLPVRPSTIVRLPHYTDAQRAFLMEKGKYGGMAFLLLQADRDFLLFDWESAQDVGKVNTEDLYGLAIYESKGKLDPELLWRAINWNGQ